MKEHLQDKFLSEIQDIVASKGGAKYRAEQLFQALVLNKSADEMTTLPEALKITLKEDFSFQAVEIIKVLHSRDKSSKYLYKLNDDNIIEGVFIRQSYGNTLCVSTQIGCKMRCAFCASGLDGLVRNLTAGEMAAQVYAANKLEGGDRHKRAVSNVVLMGSGEPLDNYDNVIKFLALINDSNGLNISMRNITLSTSGLAPKIRRLADEGIAITLAISLHNAVDSKREAIMPINRRYAISEVIAATDYYMQKTGRRVSLEYALIQGENTSIEDAENLANLIKGKDYHINLITLNEFEESALQSASKQDIAKFMAKLSEKGVNYTLRTSAGSDIEAACGQLRRSFLEEGQN